MDGWGYQENVLPLYQAKQGHSVSIIASSTHHPPYATSKDIEAVKHRGNRYELNGIQVYRIPTYIQTTAVSFINRKLYRTISDINPDLIFHHDVTVPSLIKCVFYKITHPKVKIVVDNHADKINESPNKLWRVIYNSTTKLLLKLILPYVTCFYGVTPARCEYLKHAFGINETKIKLLPIGADIDKVDQIKEPIEELRSKYGIPSDSIVLVSGGKMGVDKGTRDLITAFSSLQKEYPPLVLLLFGKFTDEEVKQKANTTEGVYVQGWCDRRKTLELLKLSDIACWPLLHTTLIEDAIACSLPLAVFNSGNTSHSVEGNGVLLNKGDSDELKKKLGMLISDIEAYKINAVRTREKFSYDYLAKQIFKDCEI